MVTRRIGARVEGWRGGGVEGGREGGREGWRGGEVEGWRGGGVEGWRGGGVEGGRQGGREGGREAGRQGGRQGGREAGREGGREVGRARERGGAGGCGSRMGSGLGRCSGLTWYSFPSVIHSDLRRRFFWSEMVCLPVSDRIPSGLRCTVCIINNIIIIN